MSESTTYSVISTGRIKDEFSLEDVQGSFAKLFKTSPEKARAYVGVKRVLKKDMNLSKAQALKSHLEKIGMVIALKEHRPLVTESESLLLAMEEPQKPRFENPITCPKCNLEQEKAEQCSGCGVYLSKVLGIASDQTATNNVEVNGEAQNEVQADATVITTVQHNDDAIKPGGLVAAAIAAVIGALLWKFIAVLFGYEFGIIAWGIGGAVGFAAAMFGSKGLNTGVICGVFTLLAILGGKYMAIASLQSTWANEISAVAELENEEFKEIYQEELIAAKVYNDEVDGEKSLKQFMAEYGYSVSFEADKVTSFEIETFKEYAVPRLEKMASRDLNFQEWKQETLSSVAGSLKDYSTFELMQESMGILGFVFLFLGVVTAFRLGKGEA